MKKTDRPARIVSGLVVVAVTMSAPVFAQLEIAEPATTAEVAPAAEAAEPAAAAAAPADDETAGPLADAASEEDASEGIDEIIVTAQRQRQTLQQVPVAVTAMTGDQMANAGMTDSLSISDAAPSVEIKTFSGVPNIYIRGIGNGDYNPNSISPVTVYRDEVPLASNGSQIFSLVDLEGVEILRGPQGTLFGKNTIAGAILYKSRLPGNRKEGYARVGTGRFGLIETEAAATIPLVEDKLALRVAGVTRRRDGERTNVHTGDDANNIDEQALRAILRATPDEQWDLRFAVGMAKDRSDFTHGKSIGLINGADASGYSDPYPNDNNKLNFNGPSRTYLDNEFATFTAIWSFAPGYEFKSISAYDASDIDNRNDGDQGTNSVVHGYYASSTEQLSQEFQLAYVGDRMNWVAGLFLFTEDFKGHPYGDVLGEFRADGGDFPLLTDSTRTNSSYAAFGQGAYQVRDDLRVTLGLRYTLDEVKATHRSYLAYGYFDPVATQITEVDLVPYARLKDDWGAWSGRIGIDYNFTPDVLGYLSATRGFKAGGFNIGSMTQPIERTRLDPEYLNAYEIGLKTMLLDRRLRLNLSAFHYDYDDLQVAIISDSDTTVPTLTTENAASAQIDGFEAELLWKPVPSFELGANASWLDARFKSYPSAAIDPLTGLPRDFSDNRMPGAPKFGGGVNATYTRSLAKDYIADVRLDYNYSAKRYFTAAENDLISSKSAYGLLNARIALTPPDGGWDVALWGKNLTGKDYIYHANDGGIGYISYVLGERRTYGVRLSVYF